jgi:hypothetical protein
MVRREEEKSEGLEYLGYLRIYYHPPTIHGVAMKLKKKGWTKRPKRTLGKDANKGQCTI